MKNLLIFLFSITLFFTSPFSFSQKVIHLLEYPASNGITYKIGDEIKLGRGSNPDGKFIYVTIAGWAVSADAAANQLPAGNTGLIVTVKKMKKYNYKRYKGVYFTVGGGNITNYNLDIEAAIQSCEIEDCKKDNASNQSSSDKYDKLKKLKALLDEGVLTQEEYDVEKKKLLDEK